MCSLQRCDSAKGRGLLRLLFVWFHEVSADPVARSLLSLTDRIFQSLRRAADFWAENAEKNMGKRETEGLMG
jgi:hypothetical protein